MATDSLAPSEEMIEPQPTGTSAGSARALPLERKLPLVVLGLFTIVFAVSLGASYVEIRRSALEAGGERLSALGQSFAAIVEQQTTVRLNAMRRAARDSAVQAALRTPDKAPSAAALKAMIPLVTPADSLTPPQLWGPSAAPLGSKRLEPAPEQQQFREELLKLAVSPRDSGHVSRMRTVNGHMSYFNAVPVRGEDGSVIGFIVQERRINTNPRNLPLIRSLIGSDIDFFVRNASDNTWVQLTGTLSSPPTGASRALDSLTIYTHGMAGDMLSSTAAVRGTPLLITVERPMRAIVSRPLSMIRGLIVVAVVLALLGAAAAWIISRRIVRPLGDLTRAAEGIAHGHYDRRVDAGPRDEIGRLGVAFNRMAEEVQSSSETSTRALTRLTESMETQEFLAEASRIVAGSVSDEALLVELARYCVPRLADYCTIHVADDDGTIRRIETAHRDPARLPLVRALQRRYPYRLDGPGEVSYVVRTQQPIIIPHLDRAAILKAAPDAEAARLIEALGPTSFMCVPLVARGHAFGAISFTMAASERAYHKEDLEIASELARRTGVAIDNAVIYRRSLALRLEAEAASNAKSDFLAKMSHEIRTPINAMMGYAELLQMGISGPITEPQARQLGRIRSSGEHLTSLINEILDLAKIEAGRLMVDAASAPAGDAIEAALNAVRPIAAAKGVELSSRIEGDPSIEYAGDPKRVHQILTNLLNNAVKFTPPSGRVSVRCNAGSRPNGRMDETGDWVCVTVEDTGVGIDPDDVERIFHPFVQVDTGYTRAQGGTGLGLTISRNLAHLMGGDITVESTPGLGSRFILWLPCPIRALASA